MSLNIGERLQLNNISWNLHIKINYYEYATAKINGFGQKLMKTDQNIENDIDASN